MERIYLFTLVFALICTSGFCSGVENDMKKDNDANIEIVDGDEEIKNYESPKVDSKGVYFTEHFDDINSFPKKWIKSQAKKDDIPEEIAKYDGEWENESPIKQIWKNDFGLVLKSKAKHAAISSYLHKTFEFKDKVFVVQYEVTMQNGQECGGSYIKLLSKGVGDLKKFNDKTPYTIMFGPDKCGNDIKLHFIFRHVNPVNGTITEKHCRKPKERLEEHFKDHMPHLYQLLLKPDNTFEIRVDHRVINEGSLLSDFNPPVNPPMQIDDPDDKKPEDWDEREKIPDPNASKPEDWDEDAPPQIPDPKAVKPEGWLDDEPEMISDPNAIKPEDWDSTIDGDWEGPLIDNPICKDTPGCGQWKAPLIINPEYKGKWRAPLINNPNYQGKWVPHQIPNPEYFEDLNPFKMTPIEAVGIEIWSMSNDILFDNIIITDDINIANEWAAKTFDIKKQRLEKQSQSLWERTMRYMGHSPGWWALYFLYCAIPIGLYIRYLYRRAKEDSFVGRLINYTTDKPWLWVVYIAVVAVPLLFLIYMFCSSKEKVSVNKSKKTDESNPDDQSNENISKTNDTLLENYDNTQESNSKTKKSDLDVNDDKDDQKETKSEGELVEDPLVENEADPTTQSATNSVEGARKRRPRKD